MGSANSNQEQDRHRFSWLKSIVKIKNSLIIKYLFLGTLIIKIFLSMINAYWTSPIFSLESHLAFRLWLFFFNCNGILNPPSFSRLYSMEIFNYWKHEHIDSLQPGSYGIRLQPPILLTLDKSLDILSLQLIQVRLAQSVQKA